MGESANIWVVEDDPGCRFLYEEVLGPRHDLTMFDRLDAFRQAISKAPQIPALILADLCLPDGTLLELLQSYSEELLGTGAPLIVVSSVGEEAELRSCFEHGVADYLVKPFTKGELLVKVERCIEKRRMQNQAVKIDAVTMTVVHGDRTSQALTARELQIMTLLHSEMPRPIERDLIMKTVWDLTNVSPKTLDVHLFNLRQKLTAVGLLIEHLPPSLYRLKSRP